jgi:hypothetical protein
MVQLALIFFIYRIKYYFMSMITQINKNAMENVCYLLESIKQSNVLIYSAI